MDEAVENRTVLASQTVGALLAIRDSLQSIERYARASLVASLGIVFVLVVVRPHVPSQ